MDIALGIGLGQLTPGRRQFPFRAGLVLDDVSCDRARRYRQRAGQIHLPGAAAAGEIAVLRADHHLSGRVVTPGPALMHAPQLGSITCAPAF